MNKLLLSLLVAMALLVSFVVLRWLVNARRHWKAATQKLADYEQKFESSSTYRTVVANTSAQLQQASSFEELARAFMKQAIPLLGAQYGALYLFEEQTGQLSAIGGYANVGAEGVLPSFALGDGLVGLAALNRQPLTIYSLPDTGVQIISGVGKIPPKQLALQAIVQKDQVVGVLEFASLGEFSATGKQFLDEMMPTLAMTVEILDRSLRTQSLLSIKQEQAALLQRQQAELESSFAERDAANKALQSQLEELAGHRSAMLNILEDLETSRALAEEATAHARSELQQADQSIPMDAANTSSPSINVT